MGLKDLRAPVVSGLETTRTKSNGMIEIGEAPASGWTEWGEWADDPSSALVEGVEVGLPPDEKRDLADLQPATCQDRAAQEVQGR